MHGMEDTLTRAERRHRFARAVARARFVIHTVWKVYRHPGWRTDEDGNRIEIPTDEDLMARRMAETHCRPCPCRGCTSHKDVPPRRERGFEEPCHHS